MNPVTRSLTKAASVRQVAFAFSSSAPASFSLTVTSVAEFKENGWELHVTPHPVTNTSVFEVTAPNAEMVSLALVDMSGSTSDLGMHRVDAGRTVIPVELINNVSPGIYVLTVKSNGAVVSRLTLVIP